MSNSAEQRASLATVGIVTRDRPVLLGRAVASFAANAMAHGRPVRFVVADDTSTADGRAACRAVLGRANAVHGVEVLYAGRDDKERFAARLASVAGVDDELVRFALFDDAGIGVSVGANRNALVLHGAGEAFVMTDDDTVAEFASSANPAAGLAIGRGDGTEFRFFADRDSAVSGSTRVAVDMLGMHERWLGRCVPELMRQSRSEVHRGNGGAEVLRVAEHWHAHVMTTVTGVFGDSGMFSAAPLLTGTNAHALREIHRSEATYQTAMTSREVLRVVPRPTLAPPMPLMTTSLALDARRLLPPFVPVLRNEDGVFGATLARACPDGLALHVPYAVLHAAEGGRVYQRDCVGAGAMSRWCDLVGAIICAEGLPGNARDRASRLSALGDRFKSMAAPSEAAFEAKVQALLADVATNRATRIRSLLDGTCGAPAYWINDLRAHLGALERSVASGRYFVPSDLPGAREEALRLARELIATFGELLAVWPVLVAAAHHLRDNGEALAVPIR